ncbi:hypothetical protein DFQ28_007647 [Apophysomyces sp. BC1034]|nr:hypothetical protein DFQ30_003604 [Apophysomyces sp. BC1015]KAG0186532.1 hypothetical protein DFQ28_007647 [Apophysomyces sp. BC1034]
MTSTHTTHGLIRNDLMLDLLAKIHKDIEQHTTDSSISVNNVYIEKMISSSSLPGLGDTFTFAPPTTELLNALNMDFRLCPSLLHAVAVLHTGSLIITTNNALFTLTVEAYSRAKYLDSHGETNMKSFPSFYGSLPNGLSVGIHEEADGGAAKMKLKIGTKTMNVLIDQEEQNVRRP